MAYKKKLGTDVTTSYPSGLATWPKITSWVKQIFRANTFEFYELEAFEVEQVNLNDASISGRFIRPDGESLNSVAQLRPNITQIPVVGEHVIVGEYNGQFYYSHIINRRSSKNENTFSSTSSKMGKRFERRNVVPISINEGSIIFEGRYGNSVHFDRGRDFSPQILLRVNKDFNNNNNSVREDIDNDDASIYLTSDGLSTINFDGNKVEGKKVLIKSNGIFISGRDEVRINAPNLSVIKDEIKLGNKNATESVVLGDKLETLIRDVISAIGTLTFIDSTGKPCAPSPTNSVAFNIVKSKLTAKDILSKKVKTI
tara:strand:- start:648 stop:1586 length:939 start_codon:yes stop_codon:yes gene_type:complete